jgi:DNA-binding XRE family transcriptional regulator
MAGRRKFRDIAAHINADPVHRAHIEEAKRAMDDVIELAQLRELREQRGAKQAEVADTLGASQANVSQIESRAGADGSVYLATLAHYIDALGGRLEISAVFPDETIRLVLAQHEAAPAGGAADSH